MTDLAKLEGDRGDSHGAEYVAAVNRAIDFVVANLGASPALRLEDVAKAALFSPFHFHRIFRAIVGETLANFVKRLRLERALYMLSHDRPASLTQIALACGFASSSDFSRSFKQRYGVAPSRFDLESFRAERRADLQAAMPDEEWRAKLARLPAGENPDAFEARLRRYPERIVAYLRVLDPYKPDRVPAAAKRLLDWAIARGCADGQWLGYMWDDPDIVALSDCRYDVGLVVDRDFVPEGEVGRIVFPKMTVAEIEVRGPIDLEMRAIDWIYGTWLPQSGYLPTEQPSFEAWIGRPFAHGFEHFELFVQLPVTKS